MHSVQNKKGQELANTHVAAQTHWNPAASEQGEEGQRVLLAMWGGVLRLGLKHSTWDF